MMAFRSLSVISVMIVTHRLNAAEDVVINMQAAPTDPLVEMMWPPSGSPDRYDFTDEGLVIEQQGDSIGDPVGVIGLRTMIPAQGDFEIKLDLKVTKLQPPTSGWGQGMVFAVFLDDQEETILKLNQVFNNWRARAGLPYWSLSQYLKLKVKNAVSYISSFENALADEARKRGLDGVICGHIHKPEIRDIDGIMYCNDGDWVESLSALVEEANGELRLVSWHDIMLRNDKKACESKSESEPALVLAKVGGN